MIRFLTRRLLIIPPILLLISFLGFSYAHLARPVRASRIPYLVSEVAPTGKLQDAYADFLGGALALDLGSMAGDDQTVLSAILEAALASAGLLAIAFVLSLIIGSILGFLGARANPSRVSRWIPLTSTVGLSMPSFFIGTLLVVGIVAIALRNPGSGFFLPTSGFGWDVHLILPVLTLLVRPTLFIAGVIAGLLVFEFEKQYITTARSQGNPWNVIRRRHAFKNVLAPIAIAIALSTRLLVGELILVEWLFGWPGLGSLLAQTLIPSLVSFRIGSPLFLDPPVVATLVTIIAGLFLAIDLFASGFVRTVDPRLRADVEETAAS